VAGWVITAAVDLRSDETQLGIEWNREWAVMAENMEMSSYTFMLKNCKM